MAKGDQYCCDWCTYSWRTKSDILPTRCPSCEHENIINETESFRDILGKENILQISKKKIKNESEPVEEKKKFVNKFFKFFKKK